MEATKICIDCGRRKPLSEFYRAAGMRDGYRSDCKVCNLAAKKRRYDADPGRDIARVEKWRRENPEHFRAYQAEYRQRPDRKRKMRDLYYRRMFGLTADDVDSLIAAQAGGCAICKRVPDRLASLHVDHDHDSGAVRGILCLNCNQGIGNFHEDPARLEAAAAYLRSFCG